MLVRAFLFPALVAAAGTLDAAAVTFTRDVAPVLYAHCAACHHPNDIAPMPLLTYQQTRPWARSIREAVLTRKMPPWYADPRYGHFSNDARLSDSEIAVLTAWVDQGAKEGDPALLPPAPTYSDNWKIGKPDVIFAIPEDHIVDASGPDEYINFTVPTNFDHDVWVQAAELKPGNRRVVHHAHVFLAAAPKADSKATPAAPDPTKNYFIHQAKLTHMNPTAEVVDDGCLVEDGGNIPGRKIGDGFGPISSYVPGKAPDVWPAGTAKRIPAGASLTFQIHYSKVTGKPETDRTSVGLILAKDPPVHMARRIDISNFLFKIPAHDPDHEVSDCHTFTRDILVTSFLAHMHFRGKDMRFEAIYPDGRHEILCNVPNYNFSWQMEYLTEHPVLLPKGTKIIVRAHFDNSTNNAANPDPDKDVRWGEPTYEEMMDGWVEYILADVSLDRAEIQKYAAPPVQAGLRGSANLSF